MSPRYEADTGSGRSCPGADRSYSFSPESWGKFTGVSYRTLSRITDEFGDSLDALTGVWLYRNDHAQQRVSKAHLFLTRLNNRQAWGLKGRTFLYDIFGNLVRERILEKKRGITVARSCR